MKRIAFPIITTGCLFLSSCSFSDRLGLAAWLLGLGGFNGVLTILFGVAVWIYTFAFYLSFWRTRNRIKAITGNLPIDASISPSKRAAVGWFFLYLFLSPFALIFVIAFHVSVWKMRREVMECLGFKKLQAHQEIPPQAQGATTQVWPRPRKAWVAPEDAGAT